MLNLNGIRNLALTGANGFVGKSIVDLMSTMNTSTLPQQISLLTRNGISYEIPKSLKERTQIFQQDLKDAWKLPPTVTHILSLAADGSRDPYSEKACLEFSKINENLVAWIARQSSEITVFHASSGACFGEISLSSQSRTLDGKDCFRKNRLKVENFLSKSAEELRFDLRIGRLFSFSGKNILQKKQYAISSFVLSALENSLISLRGDPLTRRSYLHQNAMSEWILTALINPNSYRDLQIGSSDYVEMAELAEYVARQTNSRVEYPLKYDPGDIYIPNNSDTQIKLEVVEGLNWKDAVLEMIAEARKLKSVKYYEQ